MISAIGSSVEGIARNARSLYHLRLPKQQPKRGKKFNLYMFRRSSTLQLKPSISTIIRKMSSKPSPALAKIVKVEPLSTENAKWTTLSKITYLDPAGTERLWESASRPTKPATSDVDAVAILAILRDTSDASYQPQVLLQKQFRPPTGGVAIEFPAGLVDPNETLETTALRELKEETGYIGEFVSKTPVLWADPGFCSTNLSLVTLDVDVSSEANKNPIPQLEEGEFIETFSVKLTEFTKTLKQLVEDGYKIDSRVQNIAQGIELAQQFNL